MTPSDSPRLAANYLIAIAACTIGLMSSTARGDQTVEGTIFKLHAPIIMLNIQAEKGERHFQCLTSNKTEVIIDGKPGLLADLYQGMPCRVTYSGGNSLVSKFEAITPKKKSG